MYFVGGDQIQPICLYELGRNLVEHNQVIISVEDNYARKNDVLIQTALARPDIKIIEHATPKLHAKVIRQMIERSEDLTFI